MSWARRTAKVFSKMLLAYRGSASEAVSAASLRTLSGALATTSSSSSSASTQQSRQHRHRRGSPWHFGVLASALALSWAAGEEAHAAEELPKQGFHLLDRSTRRRTFFKYEKRIRDLSSPEKVFEYFAREKQADGSAFMHPSDLLSALVAVYPPDDSASDRAGSLPGERPPQAAQALQAESDGFFKMFDTNGDGLISFSEYLLLLSLLSIPTSDITIAFQMIDDDESGEIDRDEFLALTKALRQRSRQASNAGGGRSGFKGGLEVEGDGLMAHFFGAAGDKKLDLATFTRFLQELHAELVRLEFQHYDFKDRGYMRGKDFARSLAAAVDTSRIDAYLHKIDAMPPELADTKVTFEQFDRFALLRREWGKLAAAMHFYHTTHGDFKKDAFTRAVGKITGGELSPAQVDIIFWVFDANEDGDLSVSEFIRALRKHEGDALYAAYGPQGEAGTGMGFFECMRNCAGWSS